ncbi:hypothetical protein ACRRGR_002273 [Vibrio alginolyticus]
MADVMTSKNFLSRVQVELMDNGKDPKGDHAASEQKPNHLRPSNKAVSEIQQ